MLRTDSIPRPVHAALEQAKSRFHGIGVDGASGVDAPTLIDRLMPPASEYAACRAAILSETVGHQNVHVLGEVLADVLFKGSRTHIFGMEETQFTAPPPDADHYSLVLRSPPALAMTPTANIGFVHLDSAAKLGPICFDHSCPDAMAEVPCGFVSLDSKRTLNLARADAFLSFAEQHDSEKPRRKRQVRIVEDRVNRDAELIFA